MGEISGDERNRRWLCCDVAQTVTAVRRQLLLGRAIVGCGGVEIGNDRDGAGIGKSKIAIGAMKE